MKKVHLLYFAMAIGMIACNSNDNSTERSVKDLRVYVDSIEKDHSNYYNDETYWTNVERNYEEKKQQVETKAAQMDEKQKKEYEDLKADYEELKGKYTAERTKVKADYERRMILRTSLFGEGKIGEDMSFAFMSAQNAAATYEYFVNTVSDNKDRYSREDWDEIKLLYEAMDTRKNAIEKDLSMKDNTKIAGLKIRFSAIKTFNRGGSKVEENIDAKDGSK